MVSEYQQKYLHQIFFSSWKRFNGPNNSILLWRVLAVANRRLKLGRVGVAGHRNHDLHVVGRGPSFELGLCLDHDFNPAVVMPLYNGLNPDEWLDVCIETVGHELELSIRWYK